MRDWISNQEKSHGLYRKISESLNMHTTLVSRIVKGDQHFSFEQSVELADFFQLNELEKDYFLCMVELARAGSFKLEELKRLQLKKLKKLSLETQRKLKKHTLQLSESDLGIFYSHWHYSTIRLLTSIEKFQTKIEIIKLLDLTEERFDSVMDFLLDKNLVVIENDKFIVGPQHTHINKLSPMIPRIHTNWRQKAIEHYDKLKESEFAYTCPVTIDKKNIELIRDKLSDFVAEFQDSVNSSQPEKLMCLNIDWFKV